MPAMSSAAGIAASGAGHMPASRFATKTPIKHLVIIYQENVSFDHYFATYPKATNPSGEPSFTAASGTPQVNNLQTAHLLDTNPNTNTANGSGAGLPFRLDRTQAATADQNHAYTAEQNATHNGAMDLFPKYTGNGTSGGVGAFGTEGQVLGYFDGNTVTAYWNYAQNFAMSDNSYTDTYGPSTPGALEIVSGQTNGINTIAGAKTSSAIINDGQGGYTMINDVDPAYDVCSSHTYTVMMENSKNIGDLLNTKNIPWGGFMGGFDLSKVNADGTTGCQRQTYSEVVSQDVADYIPHHNWFQYFASTSNPQHTRPSSIKAVGYSTMLNSTAAEPANHEYDLNDFYSALNAGNFPAVSYIKMPAYQDGHAGYSNPLDEQEGVVKLVNFVQQQPEWSSTAIIIAYDDSDGWYDHQYTKPQHGSFDATADQLNGSGVCGTPDNQPVGVSGKPVNGRCGPGTRTPFIVISPFTKQNTVSHTLVTQASVVRFIEDNWLDGARLGSGSFDKNAASIDDLFNFTHARSGQLQLDPKTGSVVTNTVSKTKYRKI
ncbi:alkaline phosphatase family protein [Acetobacter sp. DmW_043]|uniref:phospholipase C n=1 Tax=Acetobacter sp. DmW_043 TaxID=1670658 RepID=UPI000A35F0A3